MYEAQTGSRALPAASVRSLVLLPTGRGDRGLGTRRANNLLAEANAYRDLSSNLALDAD